MAHQLIVVLDFGGQYSHLIARRVRECGVYCEVWPYRASLDKIKNAEPLGIILTGGPKSVYAGKAPRCSADLFRLGIPILGICYGAQLVAYLNGGEVRAADVGEYGRVELTNLFTAAKLFEGVEQNTVCWMSHTDFIARVPEGFKVTARTP
ncbi:MAG TPA: glutamine-hydrolyzing GMP synthase, partial [Clostridiales bacterium]|nr:glutamine-hydrolyzing GMP synthase [Clostridiales bacterium]